MAVKRPGLSRVALRRAGASDASGTVTNLTSADGSVLITTPTTTPDLSVRVTSVANVAALAALVTVNKYQTGAQVFVTGSGQVFVLGPVLGTVDNALIVATSDDVTKQWVLLVLMNGGMFAPISVEIDLTTPQTVAIVPPMAKTVEVIVALFFDYTQKNGTVTTGPILRCGSNATNDNFNNAGAATPGFATQAAGTRVNPTNLTPIPSGVDLSGFGVRVQVVTGAVLGTATVCKGRALLVFATHAAP